MTSSYHFVPMDGETAAHLRAGGADSYGHPAERRTSDGGGVPCRRCMGMVEKGDDYLIAAWRPFSNLHAYTETGPVFLHARDCTVPEPAGVLPAFLESPEYIVRGYGADERIVYGTGGVVAREKITVRVEELLADTAIAAVHIRSARNNCYHCKAVRD